MHDVILLYRNWLTEWVGRLDSAKTLASAVSPYVILPVEGPDCNIAVPMALEILFMQWPCV